MKVTIEHNVSFMVSVEIPDGLEGEDLKTALIEADAAATWDGSNPTYEVELIDRTWVREDTGDELLNL